MGKEPKTFIVLIISKHANIIDIKKLFFKMGFIFSLNHVRGYIQKGAKKTFKWCHGTRGRRVGWVCFLTCTEVRNFA